MKHYRYQLVLQFAGDSGTTFDRLLAFEERLPKRLGGLAEVDGHDFGNGEYNLFVHTNEPVKLFELMTPLLELELPTDKAVVAYCDFADYKYVVLAPPGYAEFRIS